MSKPFTVPNNTSGAPGFSANFFIGQVPLGQESNKVFVDKWACLLYTSPSPRDRG